MIERPPCPCTRCKTNVDRPIRFCTRRKTMIGYTRLPLHPMLLLRGQANPATWPNRVAPISRWTRLGPANILPRGMAIW
jgi:hypothetical protein